MLGHRRVVGRRQAAASLPLEPPALPQPGLPRGVQGSHRCFPPYHQLATGTRRKCPPGWRTRTLWGQGVQETCSGACQHLQTQKQEITAACNCRRQTAPGGAGSVAARGAWPGTVALPWVPQPCGEAWLCTARGHPWGAGQTHKGTPAPHRDQQPATGRRCTESSPVPSQEQWPC